MRKLNILNKEGLISDDDKKRPFTHGCEDFIFESCLDLSIGVKVKPIGSRVEFRNEVYSNNLAEFICWWTREVHSDLNGFSGFGRIDFEMVGFKIVE